MTVYTIKTQVYANPVEVLCALGFEYSNGVYTFEDLIANINDDGSVRFSRVVF